MLERFVAVAKQPFTGQFWTSMKGILVGVAAAASILAVALDNLPGSETCDSNTGSLENQTIQQSTRGDFLERTSTEANPTAGYTRDQLDDPVTWVSVAVSVVGHKGKSLTLRYSVVDATSGVPIAGLRNRSAVEFKPPGCKTTAFREEILLPAVPDDKPVFVTLDLVDEEGESLPPQEVRTKTIRSRAA